MASASGTVHTDVLKPDSLWKKFNVHKVPPGKIVLTAFGSYLIVALAWLAGAPIWAAFGLSLIPWVPIAMIEIRWTYKHYGWFVLFFVMALVQTIHYSEHCIEVIQVHIFHTPVAQSLAIFSKLNVEGVHFFGDTFLSIGTVLLLWRFPRNPWLWVAMPFQILHQAEHTFLFFTHVAYGYPAGGPGLLATQPTAHGGGLIGGGIGLNRPDLHWIYNTLYTIPFVTALVWQLRRTYDEHLAEAFHDAPEAALVEASRHLETFIYATDETVVAPGDLAERLYIITEGHAEVIDAVDGREVSIGELGPGKVFGMHGLSVPGAVHDKTIRALTPLTVLAMDEPTFRHLEAASHRPAAQAEPKAEKGVVPGPSPSTAPAV